MLNAIRHNLARLVRFSGRESRLFFWPYAGAVFLLAFVAWTGFLAPMILGAIIRMQQFTMAHPDQATVETGPGSYSISISGNHPELAPDFGALAPGMGVIVVAVVGLLAAAVARRLHDRGRAAYWGLTPLPFLAFGLIAIGRFFAAVGRQPIDFTWFLLIFLNNMVYLVVLAFLVIQLACPGTPGPNRYGDAEKPAA